MQKRNVFIALFFALALILVSIVGSRTATAQPTFSYAAETKRVYLTFDDGPSTVVTNRILDTLKEEGIKATFFIVSDRAKSRTDTLKRIANEGHTLGVHSASHAYNAIYATPQALLLDVQTCADYIARITGKVATVYRFPGGERKNFRAEVEKAGYRVVGWNACCCDEEILHASPQRLLEESVKSSRNKRSVVLLMHDSANHKNTAEMLPFLIAYYRAEGYSFCAF